MRKKTLSNATLACVESAYGAIRVLEKQACHPQWRENDAWETANRGREAIRQEFPDVRFVSHSAFQSAYRERRREEIKKKGLRPIKIDIPSDRNPVVLAISPKLL